MNEVEDVAGGREGWGGAPGARQELGIVAARMMSAWPKASSSASGEPLMGGFRRGPTPGPAKLEGVQEMAWAVDLMEKGLNPARTGRGRP
ncbi:hypothetical protein ACN6AT_04135 [Streptomyces sp. JL4002]|uniref:hypothetical protein n=1 Tax=Streptomyces TaxID=1883 RepID=UPI003B28C893